MMVDDVVAAAAAAADDDDEEEEDAVVVVVVVVVADEGKWPEMSDNPIASISVLLPAPGGPAMPIRKDEGSGMRPLLANDDEMDACFPSKVRVEEEVVGVVMSVLVPVSAVAAAAEGDTNKGAVTVVEPAHVVFCLTSASASNNRSA